MPLPKGDLGAITPIDGRYASRLTLLSPFFSESALMHYRVYVEVEYLIALSKTKGVPLRSFSKKEILFLRSLSKLSEKDAEILKAIEVRGHDSIPATNHDVKAVEYFIRLKIKNSTLHDVSEWIHFGLTSEDVNNICYALILKDACEQVLIPTLRDLEEKLQNLAYKWRALPMLARTHGQSASPTTFGKEMKVFAHRIERELLKLSVFVIEAKLNGATGNYNALAPALPSVNWLSFSEKFIDSLKSSKKGIEIKCNLYTTQIEPHDSYAELFQLLSRVNTIIIDFDQDIWRYVSDGWLVQKAKEGEVGSSTMPHKVNPIDFENSEGNLGLANALFEFFARKLPISRLQRDLSDSTVERNFGSAFAYSLLGYTSTLKGLSKINPNQEAFKEALLKHPEVIAEAIQTILRKEGEMNAYEKLKELTRGRKLTQKDFESFIKSLALKPSVKAMLLRLTPHSYIGLAEKLSSLRKKKRR